MVLASSHDEERELHSSTDVLLKTLPNMLE
jgi:hypothetical protein